MLIKLPTGQWIDPAKVCLIQRLSGPGPVTRVVIHLEEDISETPFCSVDAAEQFMETVAGMINASVPDGHYSHVGSDEVGTVDQSRIYQPLVDHANQVAVATGSSPIPSSPESAVNPSEDCRRCSGTGWIASVFKKAIPCPACSGEAEMSQS